MPTQQPQIQVPSWDAWYDVAEASIRQTTHTENPAYRLALRFRPDDAEVYATYLHESETATPMDVFNGLVRQYRPDIPLGPLGLIDAEAFGRWLASVDVQALLVRIAEGFSIEWDGSNHVGRLTKDAQNAEETLREWLGEMGRSRVPAREGAGYMAAGYFLESVGPADFGITAETTDEEIREIARREYETARDEHEAIVYGLEEHLKAWRES